jgi:anti-sigma regulatory factor (Ser/Thr protein kinase)
VGAVQSFPPVVSSARHARRFVSATLAEQGIDDLESELLTSELVTNVIRHARTDFHVAVIVRDDRLRIEVSDTSSILPSVRDVLMDNQQFEDGRGLAILEAVALEWGVESRPDGKNVWFEVDRRDAPTPVAPSSHDQDDDQDGDADDRLISA